MAAIAHAGIALAAKRADTKIPLWVLMAGTWTIDIVWGVFYFAGIEKMPGPGNSTTAPWSHGLVMSVFWSLLAALVVWLIHRNIRTSTVIGLVVFSHWVIDFISHPMTALYPGDTGLPLFFNGSHLVGLGLYSTQVGINLGEYGTLLAGLLIYLLTIRKLRREKKSSLLSGDSVIRPAGKLNNEDQIRL